MSEENVCLIGVLLITYLFIMVLRPERKFDRLFVKDSNAPGIDIRFETSTGSNEHGRFSVGGPTWEVNHDPEKTNSNF